MRIPLAAELDSRDGSSNKGARLTNALKESGETGDKAVIRPGLSVIAQGSGVGNGVVAFNNELVSVYGSTFNINYEPGVADWNNYASVLAGVNAGSPTFGNDSFMSISSGRVANISANGTAWQTRGTIGGSATWHYLASDGENFVALPGSGAATTYTSSDLGLTWIAHASAIGISSPPISECSIHFDGSYYLAAVVDDDTVATMWRSSDGATWSQCGDRPVAQESRPTSWATGAGVTLACSPGEGSAYSANNGLTWNDSALPDNAAYAAFGNDTFVVIDSVGAYSYTSSDGVSFSTNTGPTLVSPGASRLYFTLSEFVLVDSGSTTFHTSPDGIDWASHTNTSGAVFDGIAASGGGTLVVVNSTNSNCATYAPPVDVPSLISSVSGTSFDFCQSPL